MSDDDIESPGGDDTEETLPPDDGTGSIDTSGLSQDAIRAILESSNESIIEGPDENTEVVTPLPPDLLPGQRLAFEEIQFVKDADGNCYIAGDPDSIVGPSE